MERMNLMQAITTLNIVIVAVGALIIYGLIKLRLKLHSVYGATNKMTVIELVKNWREQKAIEVDYHNSLRQKAAIDAKPQIDKALLERYTKEEIDKALSDPKEKTGKGLGSLGFNADKIFGKDNIDRIVGKPMNKIEEGNGTDILSKERINGMINTDTINTNRIRDATGSLNWREGVKDGLHTGMRFKGLKDAVGVKQPDEEQKTSLRVK